MAEQRMARIPAARVALALALAVVAGASAAPLGTAFTYQGRLMDTGVPATGTYDLEFRLYDAASGGAQVGTTIDVPDVPIDGGIFTVSLDFGAQFTGQLRYLDVGVRPGASTGSYTVLVPREKLAAAPNAQYASNAAAAGSAPWTGVTGKPAGFNDGVDNDTLAGLACASGQVAQWNGSAWACAAGAGGGASWSLSGNTGAGNFLGSTDNQPFELRVNNARALRVEPQATSPNWIAGNAANLAATGVAGAVIAGGSSGTGANKVTDDFGVVAGGTENSAGDAAGTTSDHPNATVGGGFFNAATGSYATIPGGYGNTATGDYSFAAGWGAHANTRGSFVWTCAACSQMTSTANDQFLISALGNVGINTNAPQATLDVAGKARVTTVQVTTSPGVGKVLTSDASGNGSWQALSSAPCARSCNGSVETISYANAAGTCTAAFRVPCFPYTCESGTQLCKDACASNADCAAGSVCNPSTSECGPIGNVCSDAWTLTGADGTMNSCEPYRCVAGSCREHCDSTADCLSGACNSAGRCV